MGQKIASKATRDGGAERFPAPAVQKSIAVDLALIGHDDQLLRDVELSILKTAKQHTAQTLALRRTVPGIGAILSLGRLYDIHAIARCPRVQDFLSSCRLVKCTQASAGKRSGTSGPQIGNAHLTWAFSEAAGLFLRAHPAGQTYLTTREKKHGAGNALPLLGHKLGRTIYSMVQRHTAFARSKFLTGSGSGGAAHLTGPPRAQPACRALPCGCRCVMERVGAHRPFCPAPLACDWTSALAPV
jgi:Transposase IS116/IS110/IS902 family